MKTTFLLKTSLLLITVFTAANCSKTSTDLDTKSETSITLTANKTNFLVGDTVNLSSITNLQNDVTSQSVFYVNSAPVLGNNYIFTQPGIFVLKSTYKNLTSNEITVIASPIATAANNFVHRVLVEEYSGTWCGNCPSILFGIQQLKQQTNNEVSVQIHLNGNDPFITTAGNNIASNQGISSVPTGKINRDITWTNPYYQNTNQVINEIKSSSTVGLAISPKIVSNNINVDVSIGFADNSLQTTLIVYVVEDKLYHLQSNYSSSLYNGQNPIPNFEYNNVLRTSITPISGELISTNTTVSKNYSIVIPANISNITNVKIVAFLVNVANNKVLNVRESAIGEVQFLEKI